MTHTRALHVFAGAFALSFIQCGADQGRTPDTTTTRMWIEPETVEMTPAARFDRAATPSQPVEALSDEQIAAVMSAANEAQIQQARLAQRKGKHQRVRQFALMMLRDHDSAAKKQQSMMQASGMRASGSNLLGEINTNEQSAAQTLQTASPSDFDHAYMNVQVTSHQLLLNALDRELIPAAQNAELKTLLEESRRIVEQHLEQAREIQKTLSPRTLRP